jgi:outer membrane biosynthesis protein TonB
MKSTEHGARGVTTKTRTHRRRALPFVALIAIVLASIGPVAGCARAKAKAIADAPPLEMPAPPPRDVEPNESEPPPPATLPQEPARTPTPRPRPTTPSRETRPNDPPKPEAPKTEAPPATVIEPPKPPDESARPPQTTLQTTPAIAEGEVERTIRATLTRAGNDLNRIDYRILNSDARTQYDTAKSFIRQADAAVRAKNLVFARNLADKAAALAAQLGGK